MAIEAISGYGVSSCQTMASTVSTDTGTVSAQGVQNATFKKRHVQGEFSEQTADQKMKISDAQDDIHDTVKKQIEQNEKVRQSVAEINKKLVNNKECQFGIHEATNRVIINIVDKETKEVVREVPAEKTLEMIAKVWELAGILVDEKR